MSQGVLMHLVEDRIVQRWMALEFGGLQKALVVQAGTLAELLQEEHPRRPTRGGEPHFYDVDALRRLDERLASPLLRRRLRVPVTFYLDKDLPGTAYVQDAPAIEALTKIGRARSEPREGKLFLSEPLARDFALEYPSLAQFVMF